MKKIIYSATAHTETTAELLGFFLEVPEIDDLDTSEYRGHSITIDVYEIEVSDEEVLEVTGYELEDLEAETTITSIFEDYYDLEDLEELAYDLEPIDSFDIGYITKVNEDSNRLIDDVMLEIASRLGRKFFYKYDTINGKSIRIADHTHNPRNGKCDLNVVIAEKDATANCFFYAKEDLIFDDSHTAEEIVDSILYEIDEN